MPYNTWVTSTGRNHRRLLQIEWRLRLAKRLLDMTGVRETDAGVLYLDTSALCLLTDQFLGELWVWFDATERGLLTRMKDVDAAVATVVLQGAGHPLQPVRGCHHHQAGPSPEPPQRCPWCLEVSVHVYRHALTPYDEMNAALAREQQLLQRNR